MAEPVYYRPLPSRDADARYQLAGGWTGFSRFEILQRGAAPRIANDAPAEIIDALTRPRAPIAGLTMTTPRIMAIVNATPDSFSDGGHYDPLRQAEKLVAEGADLLDIGGESTRPGATEIPIQQEIDRILPTIQTFADKLPVSVDTRKHQVASAAISAGARLVNDVSGFDFDADLPGIVAQSGLPVCLMHAQGLPETMQDNPQYDDVLLDVYDALDLRIRRAEQAGIARDRIVIDPGIGFGKTLRHNLAILRRISLFHGLGCPVLLGVSRKRFIGTVSGVEDASQRAPGTLAVTLGALEQGIQIHRVHDVATIVQGLSLWRALNENEKADR